MRLKEVWKQLPSTLVTHSINLNSLPYYYYCLLSNLLNTLRLLSLATKSS